MAATADEESVADPRMNLDQWPQRPDSAAGSRSSFVGQDLAQGREVRSLTIASDLQNQTKADGGVESIADKSSSL